MYALIGTTKLANIFQNIGKMSDIAIQNVYDYYMGLDVKNASNNNNIGQAEKLNIKVELN